MSKEPLQQPVTLCCTPVLIAGQLQPEAAALSVLWEPSEIQQHSWDEHIPTAASIKQTKHTNQCLLIAHLLMQRCALKVKWFFLARGWHPLSEEMSSLFTAWKRHMKYGKQSSAAHLDVTHTVLISRMIYLLSSILLYFSASPRSKVFIQDWCRVNGL